MIFKMVLWLSKTNLFILILLIAGRSFSQTSGETPVYRDYKDPERFEKYHKRSVTVGAWQVHTLKEHGAIVVRLKTSKILIDELVNQGNIELAVEKQLEQFAVNRNLMFAYKENFDFCKLYFIYSNNNDSLLNGARKGIFLDTNLTVDPSIEMTELFYLIAERDFAYTSSIGFVKEDSARYIKEEGNPIKQMTIVLKNKYGHQLKKPLPYAIKGLSLNGSSYAFPIKYVHSATLAKLIVFPIERTYFVDVKNNPNLRLSLAKEEGFVNSIVKLKKDLSYEIFSVAVNQLNYNLNDIYRRYPKPDVTKINRDVALFLY